MNIQEVTNRIEKKNPLEPFATIVLNGTKADATFAQIYVPKEDGWKPDSRNDQLLELIAGAVHDVVAHDDVSLEPSEQIVLRVSIVNTNVHPQANEL